MERETHIRKAALALLGMQRHSWEQGVAMDAFLDMGKLDVVSVMAREAVYRSLPDGRAAVIGGDDAVTDPCAVGNGVWAAYIHTGEPMLEDGYQRLLVWALDKAPRNEKGVLYHLMDRPEFWADSIYMLPPFLAGAGCYSQALTNFYGYWEVLYDEKMHLLHHMWDDREQRYLRPAYWGTGNGWALAALVKMDAIMPKEEYEQDRNKMRNMFRELLNSVLEYQLPNGLFRDVLDEEESFQETNLAQMAAYSIYRGILQGMLPDHYAKKAHRMRKAAGEKMTADGFIQGVCGAPAFVRPGFSPEGQAFYLLMEQAYEEWKEEEN